VHDVEGIISTVGGGSISIVGQTEKLATNFVAIGIKWFNITESNTVLTCKKNDRTSERHRNQVCIKVVES
jgi:hypothetical protein